MTNDSAVRWLTLLCSMLPRVQFACYVNKVDGNSKPQVIATYPADANSDDALDTLIQRCLDTGKSSADHADVETSHWRLAHPIHSTGINGVVGLLLTDVAAEQHDAIRQLVDWAGQWAALAPANDRAQDDKLASELTNQLLDAGTLTDALALASRMLAKRWGCVRVAIGLTENESIALNTLSDRVAFDEKSHGAAHLAVAMNEACDQSACIVFPELDSQQGGPTVNAAHRQLAAAHRASIASVPLRTPAAIVGVVTLIRNESVPFTNDDLRHLEQRAALLGRVIATRRQAEQSTASRIRCAVQRWRDDWLLAKDWRRRSAVAATAAAAAFAAFGSVSHQVSAPALLAGVSERTLASPVDGYLSEVHVRPGARVTSGDVLAVLDPSPLQRQRQQLLGQRNQLNGEYNVALSNLDGASARILQAQLAQTNVQLAHLDEQIERLAITAPFDGLVLEGDLMHATGSPVALGDALFRVTPDEGYLVRLMVDESDVSALSIGAGGRLKLAALPDAELAIEVVRINGVAQTRDGRSVIEIEAAVKGDQRYLRPGMKGVARLDAGRAGLLWIWTHSIVQRLQLWLWQFSPVA